MLRTVKNGKVTVEGISAMVLAQDDNKAEGGSSLPVIIAIVCVAVIFKGIDPIQKFLISLHTYLHKNIFTSVCAFLI